MRKTRALLVATAWLSACGDGGLGGGGGDGCTDLLNGTADEVLLQLGTERSASRHFMVLGEVGRAWATFYAGSVGIGDWPTTFRSSDPSVVRPSQRGGSEGTITAVGTGSATITAEGCGLSDQVSRTGQCSTASDRRARGEQLRSRTGQAPSQLTRTATSSRWRWRSGRSRLLRYKRCAMASGSLAGRSSPPFPRATLQSWRS